MPDRNVISNALVYVALFFLPWQTRWMYRDLTIGGETWEYGRLSLYAVEMLVFAAMALRGRPRLPAAVLPFVRPMLLFAGVALISASFSRSVTLALAALPHLAAAGALFFLVADERTRPRRAAWAFSLGLLGPCAIAWWQVASGASPAASWLGLAAHNAAELGQSVVGTENGRVLRGYGTFPHPNVFGGYLAVGLIALARLSGGARSAGTRLLYAAPAAVLSATLIVTFSRSAWLGAAVGFLAFAVGAWRSRRVPTRRALPFALLAAGAALATLAAFHVPALTRLQPAARLEAASIAERAQGYAAFADLFPASAAFGVGPGNYTLALAVLYPGVPAWSYQPLHNAPLLLLAELGLLALLPAVIFLRAIAAFLRASPTTLPFSVAFLAALVPPAFLDHYLWSLWPGLALASVTIALAMSPDGDVRSIT